MIGFQDFAPVVKDQGGFLRLPVVEQLSEPMKRANDWIKNQSVDVLNVETVVLPNIHHPHEEGSTDPLLMTDGESAAFWYQIVRVWYRYGKPVD